MGDSQYSFSLTTFRSVANSFGARAWHPSCLFFRRILPNRIELLEKCTRLVMSYSLRVVNSSGSCSGGALD